MIDLYADLESHFDKTYSLTKLSTAAYVRDPRWQRFGASVAIPGAVEPTWMPEPQLKEFLDNLRPVADRVRLIGQNLSFDAFVFGEKDGFVPAAYHDTMHQARYAIAQGLLDPEQRTSLSALAPLVGMVKGDTEAAVRSGGAALAAYANDDLIATMKLHSFLPQMPDVESEISQMHIRMAVQPRLCLDTDLLTQIALEQPSEDAKLLRSKENMAMALRLLGIEPAMKQGKRGPDYAFAKTDEFMKRLLADDDPQVVALAELRLFGASSIERTRAQALLNAGSPLPVPLMYYGAHTGRTSGREYNCFAAGHELLTPTGWVPVEAYKPGTPVMQWWPDRSAEFAVPTAWLEKEYSGEMVVFDGPMVKARTTADHRWPFQLKAGVKEVTSKQISEKSGQDGMPVFGFYSGPGSLTLNQALLMVALAADGSQKKMVSGIRTTFGFRKQRKIDRLCSLLEKEGIPYTKAVHSPKNPVTHIAVRAKDAPPWFVKGMDSWVLGLSPAVADAVLEELVFWDGHVDKKGNRNYYTSRESEADWVVTLARLRGKAYHKYRYQYGKIIRFDVFYRKGQFTSLDTKRQVRTECVRNEKVYCPTVPSGWLFVRYQGEVFISGNCQNFPSRGGVPRLRKSLLAPPGHKLLVVDSSQIEVRVLAWLAQDKATMELFASGADIYRDFASKLYRCSLAEVTPPQRQIAKAACLALGYGQGANGFQAYCARSNVKVDAGEAARVVDVYRKTHTPITAFWKKCEAEIRRTGGLQLPGGRRIVYSGIHANGDGLAWRRPAIFRKSKNAEVSKIWAGLACENIVQSVARDIVMQQSIRLSDVVLSVHDEAVGVVPEDAVEEATEAALEAFSWVPEWADGLVVKGEVKVGDNYGVKG